MVRSLWSLFFLLSFFYGTWAQPSGRLLISRDQRHLVYADGRPFFYLGDTAWELFHRLNREEAARYLENRAAKGFTVIQAVVLAELDGLHAPNAYGDTPLVRDDPTKPDPNYFAHVDFVVDQAAELGLFIGMLPTWGDKFNKKWGVGPEIFTEENAFVFGKFLASRYRDKPVIWILGGDRNPEEEADYAIIRSMARGLREGDDGAHLITYHPMGGHSSSQFWQQDSWLDFNMFQSGHGEVDNPNYRRTAEVRALPPVRPVLDGEPCYEDHPINWNSANGWFDAFDSRRAGYWSMLSGACGHTYGNHNIWQMWQRGRQAISQARTPWTEALDYPGAFQAGYMRRLFESRPWQQLVPDQSIIVSGPNTGGLELRAAIAGDGSFLIVYSPDGSTFELSLEKMPARRIHLWWFNPRQGTAIEVGERIKPDRLAADPPADPGRGNDWVLVIDDASRGFPVPGGPGER